MSAGEDMLDQTMQAIGKLGRKLLVEGFDVPGATLHFTVEGDDITFEIRVSGQAVIKVTKPIQ